MPTYQVSYTLATHDLDEPITVNKEIWANDPSEARRTGNRIAREYVEELRSKGNAAEARSIEVREVKKSLSDPL